MVNYPRYIEVKIKEALKDTPVVFIAGPRQTGKTTLVKSIVDSEWKYITLDDQTQLALAAADPSGYIKNIFEKRIIIDEIQRVPELLLSIKQSIDENRTPGRFLLTGSSNVLVLPKVADSLAGRVETIHLNPLSECEIKNSKPNFLSTLLMSKVPSTTEIRIKNYLIERMVKGCFPDALTRTSEERVQAWYKQYVNSLVQKDIKEISHIDHPEKMLKLLKLAAFYSSKLINFSEFGDQLGLDKVTVKKYIGLLEHLFLIRQLPAWHSNEYKRLVKTPKLHVADTGLICALREINQEYLYKNLQEQGFLLETFVYDELIKQATWRNEDLMFYHYRDKDKVEVDFIIENSAGDCFAIEVKASTTLNPSDFTGLNRFKNIAGKRFKIGILLYDGDHVVPFGDQVFAVPLAALWS